MLITIIDIDNLYFVSLNKKYTKSKTTHKLILTDEYRKFKDTLNGFITQGMKKLTAACNDYKFPLDPPYQLFIQASCYLDYDNILKPIGDSLENTNVITNDKFITSVTITKSPIQRGAPGSLQVFIKSLKDNDNISGDLAKGI